jgi:hypothetical protein
VGWGGEDGRPLARVAWLAVVVGGLGGCLDLVTTGSYGGSRAIREEKTERRKNRGPAWPPELAWWKTLVC